MKILYKAKVLEETGFTEHYVNSHREMGFTSVAIGTYDDSSYYLLYYSDGKEITDTLHETIEDAKLQAYREFEMTDWETVDENGV